ncbi:DNA sulfur modification protein DndE [Halorubrum salsamenti]|jgi:DNA sulfur modification protein DndE|uniref:DNA sulfur modification protein DndE n=1 Tax=Halorubrum salsamenti TaxID=2583990 RepID=UPI0011A32E40|nr:DNA sulfur modification protein DndE [Halorubrum salsamenti]
MTDKFNRVSLDSDVTNKLERIQEVTQLTPNFIARIGLCYSLNEPRAPNTAQYDTEGQTINRYTLLGEHDALYMALVRQRMLNEGRDPDEDLYDYFLAHLNRGVGTLSGRLSGLDDLQELIPDELKQEE